MFRSTDLGGNNERVVQDLVEQYLDFCRELADVVYIMDRGRIVHEGVAEDLGAPKVRKLPTV